MELIKETIQQLIEEWKTKKKLLPKDGIAQIVHKTLSAKEREHVRLIYCRNGILGLAVDSSAWLYQLTLHKTKLLDKLNKKIKDMQQIKDVRFHIG